MDEPGDKRDRPSPGQALFVQVLGYRLVKRREDIATRVPACTYAQADLDCPGA